MILTTLATLACGFAPNGVTLIIFTALMGLFSAAAVTPAVGTLGAVYSVPSKRRNRAFACFSAGNPLGFVVGTLIAGVVLEITRGKSLGRGGFWGGDDEGGGGDGGGWRVCFWVFCVLTAGFGVLVKWTVPKDKVVFSAAAADGGNGSGSEGDEVSRPEIVTPARVSAWEVLRRFDLVGAVLVTAGVSALSAGLTYVSLPFSSSLFCTVSRYFFVVLVVLCLVMCDANGGIGSLERHHKAGERHT
jgi:MFS family permease